MSCDPPYQVNYKMDKIGLWGDCRVTKSPTFLEPNIRINNSRGLEYIHAKCVTAKAAL